MTEHECTPPGDPVAADLSWDCTCGARWTSYLSSDDPTWRILCAEHDLPYDPESFAWRGPQREVAA